MRINTGTLTISTFNCWLFNPHLAFASAHLADSKYGEEIKWICASSLAKCTSN
jgi:hypothetical protein